MHSKTDASSYPSRMGRMFAYPYRRNTRHGKSWARVDFALSHCPAAASPLGRRQPIDRVPVVATAAPVPRPTGCPARIPEVELPGSCQVVGGDSHTWTDRASRLPDYDGKRVVADIKNVERLELDDQMVDFFDYAADQDKTLVLIVRQDTIIGPGLANMQQAGLVRILKWLPPGNG